MESEKLTPVVDKVAEELESAGLYRRAATRWLQVFFECSEDSERAWVSRHRLYCLSLSLMPVVKSEDNYSEIYRAVNELHREMGLELPERALRSSRVRGRRR